MRTQIARAGWAACRRRGLLWAAAVFLSVAAPARAAAPESSFRITVPGRDWSAVSPSKETAVHVLELMADCRSQFLEFFPSATQAADAPMTVIESAGVPGGDSECRFQFAVGIHGSKAAVRVDAPALDHAQPLVRAVVRVMLLEALGISPDRREALAPAVPRWLIDAVACRVLLKRGLIHEIGIVEAWGSDEALLRFLSGADAADAGRYDQANAFLQYLLDVPLQHRRRADEWLRTLGACLETGLSTPESFAAMFLDPSQLRQESDQRLGVRTVLPNATPRLDPADAREQLARLLRIEVEDASGQVLRAESVVLLPLKRCCRTAIARALLIRNFSRLMQLKWALAAGGAGLVDPYLAALYQKSPPAFWRDFAWAENARLKAARAPRPPRKPRPADTEKPPEG